jgi:predicted porin
MKKSLIALAALAAVSAASAQSTVTISGLVDFSAINNTKITTATASTKTSTTGVQNTFSTGQVSFAGTEDLGGGLKASFVINSGITAAAAGLGDRDTNVALEGGFGTVRVGKFIPAAAYGFFALSGAPSTAVGSIYAVGQSKTAAEARIGTTDTAGGSFERNANNVQYTSPSVSGFALNVNYGTSTSDVAANVGKKDTTQTGLSVTYANGPLMVAAGLNSRTVDAEGTTTAGAKNEADLNWIGASYDLGAAKLFASHVMREDKTNAAITGAASTSNDLHLTSLGVAVPMGAYTFAASTYTGKNKVTAAADDNTKLSGYQLSARYALSKRTTAYALVGTNKIARDSGNTTGATFKESGSMIGLIHSF